MQQFSLKVQINEQRPDFRVFKAFFFGDDFHNCDSDGDASPVYSRNWTELYMRSRENKQWFDIQCIEKDNLIFEITSDTEENVYQIAYFLAKETNGTILNDENQIINKDNMFSKMGNFNLEERLHLAEKSIWRKSSKENPYPNLQKEK
ncbi:hypothetical protein CAPN001_13090 [Capnocytophaga stomatis]|uniref:Uncharacterized protein n=1 Tax=Capnocytophaga stomatis TaxID=1848904 RepID=A0A250FVP1_9FLAO|nr:hypothetical protein [Capnocytophaga stomatis]ATA89153.1 hypothetical protein CGC58_05115 [Capnocytophaga stomatis]GIJ93980.1 hypothetical protein CAPN002_11980 [Capnocytophaga stomatis]GIJ96740.1 hypothetical protein CAPN001_13090 [Capnocytophaga stomatis]GIM48628.1 hypothetical protein CAPN003_00800 [Capnocytophaga stomatis]